MSPTTRNPNDDGLEGKSVKIAGDLRPGGRVRQMAKGRDSWLQEKLRKQMHGRPAGLLV